MARVCVGWLGVGETGVVLFRLQIFFFGKGERGSEY